jgi:hypothetical protein
VNTSKRILIALEAGLIPGRVVPVGGFSVLCKEAFKDHTYSVRESLAEGTIPDERCGSGASIPNYLEMQFSKFMGQKGLATWKCSLAARCRSSSGAACGSPNVGALSTVC